MIEQYINHKFRELMETPWEDMPAFKLGIIDGNGKILKSRTELVDEEERAAYPSMFYTLCWNLRNLMERADEKSVIGPVVSIAMKLREFCSELESGTTDGMVIEEINRREIMSRFFCEEPEYKSIEPGEYIIRGKKVSIETALFPCEEFFGHPVYRISNLTFVIEEVTKEDAPVNAVGHGNIAGVSPGQEPPGKRGLYFHRNKKKTKELKRRTGNL